MTFKVFIHRLIFIVLSLIALIVYILHPNDYVYSYNLYCMLQFIGSFIIFLILKKKKNYFDFDILFLITCFFAFFAYPVLIFPIDPYYFFAFNIKFDHTVISQGTALALLGLEIYMTGSIFYNAPNTKPNVNIGFYPLKAYTFSTDLLLIFFIILGGYTNFYNAYKGIESAESGLFAYIHVMLITFLIVSICMQYSNLLYIDRYKLSSKYIYKPFLFLIFAYVIIVLSTGSRTVPLQIVLAMVGLYTLIFKPMSLKLTLILIGIGVFSLASISYMRTDGGKIGNIYDAFIDIIIVNRNTFAAIEYVNNNGYTYGTSMLSYLLQPIPFGQSIIFNIFNLDPNYMASSKLLTTEALGYDRSIGLGTNIIADIYLSFGVIGIIIFMFFGGWFVSKAKYLAKYKMNYMVIYAVLIANSVFLVRAEFFYCLQEIIWALIVFYFTKPLYLKKYKSMNYRKLQN